MIMAYEWFISYRRKRGGENQARQIAEILAKYVGKDKVFYDRESLHYGNWRDQIYGALKTAEHFVIVLGTQAYVTEDQSNNIGGYRYELEYALTSEKKITVIEYDKKSYYEVIKEYPKLSDVQKLTFNVEYNFAFEERLCKHFGLYYAQKESTIPTIIHNIQIPEHLITRRDMLDKLDNEFDSYKCVIVSGNGGSGKTALAYLYAKEKKFNNIAWVTVNNGKIKDVFIDKIAALLFTKEAYEGFTRINENQTKLDVVKSELSKIQGDNLLVFDINTNNTETKQEIENRLYQYLPSGDWKTLVLTRTVAENPSRFATIKMDTMTAEDAKKLFLNNWTRTKIVFTDDQLTEIVKELYYHPLMVEQAAIVFSKGHEKSAEEIITKIKDNSKVNNTRTKKILSGLAIEDKKQQDTYTYLINLCNINNLSEEEKFFLAVYVTWPEEPIDYEVISTLLPDTDETLDSLIEKGILSRNNADQFSIHSLMADVIREQINISEFDYSEYLDNIDNILRDDIKSVTLHRYSKCIASSFINYGICEHIALFCTFLNKLLNNNDVILYQLPMQELYHLANEYEKNADPDYLANLYNTIARVEKFKNNLSDAKMHYEKALEVIESAEENDETLNSKSAYLQNLAMLEENLGETDSAKKHFEESIEIRWKLPETPQRLKNLATTMGYLATLEMNLGDTDSAKKHYEEAVEIKRKLPETPQCLDSLAASLANLADLEVNLGDIDSAKMHLQEAIEIEKKLPETPQYLDSMATTLNKLAKLAGTLNDIDSAKKHYEEAVEIFKRLPETPEYLEHLTNSLAGLAILEENLGNTGSALMHYEECLEISRQIGNEDNMKFFMGKILIL